MFYSQVEESPSLQMLLLSVVQIAEIEYAVPLLRFGYFKDDKIPLQSNGNLCIIRCS